MRTSRILFLNSNGGLRPPSELLSGYFCPSLRSRLVGFIELVIYTSLIDVGYSHTKLLLSGRAQILFAGRNTASVAQTSSLSQIFTSYFCAGIRGVSQTLTLSFIPAQRCVSFFQSTHSLLLTCVSNSFVSFLNTLPPAT